MPPQMTYSAEAYRLMNEFVKALDFHVKTENYYGMNGLNDTVPFITKDFLSDYWSDGNVYDLLLSLPGGVTYDISLILRDYIAVFSILTKLGRPDWISKFLSLQIKDTSLPLLRGSKVPKPWVEEPHMDVLWREFIEEQWMFCPYMFDRLSDADISESHILPIQSKDRLQSDAAEGDLDGELAILYRVKLHPSYGGDLTYVVFKEYQRSDPIASTTYENEISIYKALIPRDGSEAFGNIIEYYGSFQIQALGLRTIILEYANGGDLLTLFKEVEPPTEVDHLIVFWTKFFDLLLGLQAIHNLVPPNTGRESVFLEGIHQDIRPQNVLLIRKSSSSHPYDVTFKLVDFGTGFVKKQSLDQLRGKHRDNLGNAIYSSPESLNGRLQPESDVWALGALASETLIWSIKGWNGVENFFNLRGAQTMQGLPDTHRACFHDGIHRLSFIEDHHREVLKDKWAEDKMSPLVSRMILEHMLVEHPSTPSPNSQFRQPSSETYRLWKKKLYTIFPDGTPPVPRHSATEPLPVTTRAGTNPNLSEFGLQRPNGYSSIIPRRPETLHSLSESFDVQSMRRGTSQYHVTGNPNLHNEIPIRQMSPKLDRSSLIEGLMEDMDHATQNRDMQHDPPRFDADPVTIGTIYEKFIVPKDRKSKAVAAFSKLKPRSTNDQENPLKVHPELGSAVLKLKNSYSSGREQVFLIDDSKSMSSSRDSVAKTVRVLASLIKKGDVDPDRSIELYFASQIGVPTKNSDSKPLEHAVKEWNFNDAVCEMGRALEALLLHVLPDSLTSSPKPVSVYVLTNGLWSDKKPTSLCSVDESIEKALQSLDDSKAKLGKKWLGIQFIGFFDEQSPADVRIGKKRLNFLDDKLGELFKKLGLKFTRDDIVDTREWSDDVKDILLGAVSDAVDRQESERRHESMSIMD